MMIYFWLFCCIMVLIGIFSFISNWKHLHIIYIIKFGIYYFNNLFFMYSYMNMMDYSNYFVMMYLMFSVCEGALGISILVSTIRTHGNDYFQSFSIL